MKTSEERLEIARTIMNQLGGARFCMMVGCKDKVALDSGVRFKLGRFSGVKATHCEVILDACDTYTLKTMRYNSRKLTMETLTMEPGLYDVHLAPCFRAATGLETRL